ncbi:MAG: hypothetical protein H3C43_05650 [Leptonema sp. (in: Bacteria)]|nr:hypothetical protein [Leptonema sp. (in: bacteria)]
MAIRFSVITFLVIGLLVLPIHSAWCRSYPAPYDAMGSVLAWESLLTVDNRYQLIVLEEFEHRHYFAYSPSTELAELYYIFNTPNDKAFRYESNLVSNYSEVESTSRSLLVMTSFTVPGHQNFHFKPELPLPIYGRPTRLSVWVRSDEYPHRLEFEFKNALGQTVKVDAGRLYWKGWRRLDITLPRELYRSARLTGDQNRTQFTGISIYSHPKSKPGAISLQFDHLLILSDISNQQYDGADIVDEW